MEDNRRRERGLGPGAVPPVPCGIWELCRLQGNSHGAAWKALRLREALRTVLVPTRLPVRDPGWPLALQESEERSCILAAERERERERDRLISEPGQGDRVRVQAHRGCAPGVVPICDEGQTRPGSAAS